MSTSAATKAPPGRQKSHARREAIVEQAWHSISTRGYQATSVNTIIAELGISKGSFYHHFDSKEAVFSELVERLTAEVSQRAAQDNASTNAADRLNAFIRSGWQWHETHEQVSAEILTVMLRSENAELLNRITAIQIRVITPLLTNIIEQGMQQGVFDVADAHLATNLLLPMVADFDMQLAQDAAAGNLTVNEFIRQLRFLQQVLERVLGAAPDSMAAAFPVSSRDRKQLKNFLNALQKTNQPRRTA